MGQICLALGLVNGQTVGLRPPIDHYGIWFEPVFLTTRYSQTNSVVTGGPFGQVVEMHSY